MVLLASNSNTPTTPSELSHSTMQITKLARYAVKGLSGDSSLPSVILTKEDKTFPDDRRFALLKQQSKSKGKGEFDENDPQWIHKENFLCAFSDPELMAEFQSSYEIVHRDGSSDDGAGSTRSDSDDDVQRLLTINRRIKDTNNSHDDDYSYEHEYEHALGPIDLSTRKGRHELSQYFSQPSVADTPLICATANSIKHTHQFGNTSSGVKNNNGDTRTVHLVNEATVREVEDAIGIPLNAMRFRPNIVVRGLEAWREFDFVGKRLRVVHRDSDGDVDGSGRTRGEIILRVLSKTVRCAGIGIDPMDPGRKVDMPQLLNKHFPQYGPYLGVYAVIECESGDGDTSDGADKTFCMSVGDCIELIDEE